MTEQDLLKAIHGGRPIKWVPDNLVPPDCTAPSVTSMDFAMPAKTKKQRRFMAMCSTTKGRKKAAKKCPPRKVAKEFRKMK